MITILIGVGALVGLGGISAIMVMRNRQARDERIRRAFWRAPRTAIRDVRDGQLVVVVGIVSCDAPLQAPATGRLCAAYERLEERCDDGEVWFEVAREVRFTELALRDETGEALVQVQNGELLSRREEELWDTHLGGRVAHYRVREGIVAPGERVAVLARGTHEPDPRPSAAAGYRERPTVLVLRGDRRHPILITTSPPLVR